MKIIERRNPDGKIVEFFSGNNVYIDPSATIGHNARIGEKTTIDCFAVIGKYASIGSFSHIFANTIIAPFARIRDNACIKEDEYLNGQTTNYYWDLYKIKGIFHLRYGCETHPLKYWNAKNIKMLCKKNNALLELVELTRIVATCKAFTKGL